MAFSTTSSSLHFLSLSPQALSISKPNAAPISLSLFSPKSSSPFSSLTFSLRPFHSSSTGVAFSTEFDRIEESEDDESGTLGGGGGSGRGFSRDLKLFVGNLPFNVDSAALAGLFQQAGNVEMVEVIYDKLTGRSRGFGFVTMSTVEEVELATQQFNGYEFGGRELRVNSGPPPPRRENSSFSGPRGGGMSINNAYKLYVGNLAWGVDNLVLETLFSEQGNVMEAKVVYDRETGKSRGFGFVTYSSAEEVNNAIEKLDGIDLSGRVIHVSLSESRPRRQF